MILQILYIYIYNNSVKVKRKCAMKMFSLVIIIIANLYQYHLRADFYFAECSNFLSSISNSF